MAKVDLLPVHSPRSISCLILFCVIRIEPGSIVVRSLERRPRIKYASRLRRTNLSGYSGLRAWAAIGSASMMYATSVWVPA